MKPKISEHDGITVVRDDLFPGGTKARFLPILFKDCEELVYASPAEGGAQTAIATVAKQLGKKATIFVAKRAEPHPRTMMAKKIGAKVLQVHPGYLTVVKKRAWAYSKHFGAKLMPFGADLPEAIELIADAARSLNLKPDEVWCASGSGVLMRGLAKAWPDARRFAVQIGRKLSPKDVAGAQIIEYPKPFAFALKAQPPFPSDPHYDAKAWEIAKARRGPGFCLFWNVTGPAD